jgi:hypothetical protein
MVLLRGSMALSRLEPVQQAPRPVVRPGLQQAGVAEQPPQRQTLQQERLSPLPHRQWE